MDSLTQAIQRCNVPLKHDNPTEGFGNCFPNAVVQQCRIPEVKSWLQKNRPAAIFTSPQALRQKVKQFALKSRDQAVIDVRMQYEQEIRPVDGTRYQDPNNNKQARKSFHNH